MVCSYALIRLGDNASHIAEDGGQLPMRAAPTRGGSHRGFGRGGYWSYAPKRMAFLKWACLTYFGLKRAVLTHDVYKPQILLRMTSRLFKISAGASRGWTKYVLRDLCSYSMGIRNVIGTH